MIQFNRLTIVIPLMLAACGDTSPTETNETDSAIKIPAPITALLGDFQSGTEAERAFAEGFKAEVKDNLSRINARLSFTVDHICTAPTAIDRLARLASELETTVDTISMRVEDRLTRCEDGPCMDVSGLEEALKISLPPLSRTAYQSLPYSTALDSESPTDPATLMDRLIHDQLVAWIGAHRLSSDQLDVEAKSLRYLGELSGVESRRSAQLGYEGRLIADLASSHWQDAQTAIEGLYRIMRSDALSNPELAQVYGALMAPIAADLFAATTAGRKAADMDIQALQTCSASGLGHLSDVSSSLSDILTLVETCATEGLCSRAVTAANDGSAPQTDDEQPTAGASNLIDQVEAGLEALKDAAGSL